MYAVTEIAGRNDRVRAGPKRLPAQSRGLILTVARELLKTEGYTTLSMDAVVQAAGLTRRTLYNQFISKDDLYRNSREALIHELSATIVDDIPPRMEPFDALRFFVQATYDVFKDDRNVELLQSIVRDGREHSWLIAEYQRYIRAPLVRACENYVLQRMRRRDMRPTYPRFVAEQLVAVVDALATGPQIFGRLDTISAESESTRLDVVARAYASMLDDETACGGVLSGEFPGA